MAERASSNITPSEWARRVPFAPVLSSEPLGWNSLSAFRFINPKRFQLEMPPVGAHFIVAHLLNPADMQARWNGRWIRQRTTPGTIMIMSAEQDSVWDWNGEIDEMQIFLDPRVLKGAAEELQDSEIRFTDGIGLRDRAIYEIALELQQELATPGVCTRLFADTAAQRLALALLRNHSSLTDRSAPERMSMPPYKLRRALDFIETNVAEDISIEAIASAAGMSEFHFSRAFKKATGFAPHQYLIKRRIARACELLVGSDDRIADIALSVGFASQSHFTSAFHRLCGLTPKRYRDEVRS
jgi:AraC family transcriptional regulator